MKQRPIPYIFTLSILIISPFLWSFEDAPLVWSSSVGIQRLNESTAKLDFFSLANHFESQTNKTFCGVASSTIVLNSLRGSSPESTKPLDVGLITPEENSSWNKIRKSPLVFNRYTQGSFFNEKVNSVKTRDEVFGFKKKNDIEDIGFQLEQLSEALSTYGLKVKMKEVTSSMSVDEMRNDLVNNLNSAGDYVIINYLRSAIGQKGGGHISPLGAYHEITDSFLIMDVNPNAESWVWVSAKKLYESMNTKDTSKNRGYLLISEK